MLKELVNSAWGSCHSLDLRNSAGGSSSTTDLRSTGYSKYRIILINYTINYVKQGHNHWPFTKGKAIKAGFFKLCKGEEPKEDLISPSLETVIDTDIIGVEEPASFLAVSLSCGK